MSKGIFKFFKCVFLIIKFIFKFSFAIINYTVIGLCKIIGLFFNKLRFSIAFKINFLYGFLYLFLFGITYASSLTLTNRFVTEESLTIHQFTDWYSRILVFCLAVSFVLFLVIGRIVVKRIMTPLTSMTQTVENIKENKLQTRLDTRGAEDELKDLAINFNQMMDRLELFVERQKQFVSDASHELRTPIAVIEGYAAMLDRWGKEDPKILEESIQAIKNETANMKELVEKLLFLARSDKNTQKINKSLINLSELTKQIVKETTFIDDEHELICKADETAMIFGDPHLIKELIRIFIDNAIKYTPEGGTITLRATATSKNIILSVKDTGIGISSEHIPHLFERFYRASEARDKNSGGTGLGLAIAKWIIDIHEGTVDVNSLEGEGTEFIVFFPLLISRN